MKNKKKGEEDFKKFEDRRNTVEKRKSLFREEFPLVQGVLGFVFANLSVENKKFLEPVLLFVDTGDFSDNLQERRD